MSLRFVSNDNIQEYIPAHNLLAKFGGLDTWEYVYEVERENLLKLLQQVNERTGAQPEARQPEAGVDNMTALPEEEALAVSDDAVKYDSDGDTGWSQEEVGADGSVKQVRFSSNTPPSRQSRYGNDEEDSYGSIGGSDQSLLKKGSATSLGFRRRQVTRLMSLQESPQEPKEPRERNGSLPAGSLERQYESTGPGVAVGDVILRWVCPWLCGCGLNLVSCAVHLTSWSLLGKRTVTSFVLSPSRTCRTTPLPTRCEKTTKSSMTWFHSKSSMTWFHSKSMT